MNLEEMARDIHAANDKWWRDPKTGARIERDKGQLLMLVVSELSEAMEGERKDLMDTHLPHRKMAEVEMADTFIRLMDYCGRHRIVPNLVGADVALPLTDNRASYLWEIVSELVLFGLYANRPFLNPHKEQVNIAMGVVINFIYGYCAKFGYDLPAAVAEKNAYNLTRADHSFAARLAAEGKQF